MAKSNAEKSEKKLVSRREFLVGSGAVIAAIALTACGPNTTTSTTTISTSAASTPLKQTSTPTSTSTLTPKHGGVMRIISAQDQGDFGWPPETMLTAAGQYDLETLLRGDSKGGVYPWLAESYKLADDLKSITFTLRKGVKFHDGSDFNAGVAKWNLDNMIDARKEPSWASVDIIDDYTIRVDFTQWMCTIPLSFAEGNTTAYMVSKAAFDKNGIDWMRRNPIGTGPFKQVSHTRDVSSNHVRNSDYWVKDKPYLDGIDFMYITDYTTTKMLMETGAGDMAERVEHKDAAHFKELGWNIEFIMEDNQSLIFDTANPDSPYTNQKVREAVEYAIDKEGIAKAFGYGYRVAPYQIPTRASVVYDPNFIGGRKYDLAKAKQLLTEAGYPDGFDTTIIQGPNDAIKDITIAVQANLAKVGIRAQLEFPQLGGWMANYGGPTGKWPTGTMVFQPTPCFDKNNLGGIQFISSLVAQSWLRTPEWTQAYNAAIAAPAVDVKLIRTVTDIITKDCSIIPVTELGSGLTKKPYVVLDSGQRASLRLYNWEDAWLNK